ncbi:MAG TPA: hypothetical protein VNZ44_17465 [Pyrinomonadaceae bacterium]|nr:hypothetical protein [Pyrinomonadaceae bacterium]
MFDSVTVREARPVALMKRAALPLLTLCAVTALSSGYRAYYQVYDLRLHVTESTLRAGSAVEVAVAGSGRTTLDVRVELIQGDHSETLAAQQVRGNEWASFDPRPRKASRQVVLTPEQLARFASGPATLRATATGRPQWLRLPPPTVREEAVNVRRE